MFEALLRRRIVMTKPSGWVRLLVSAVALVAMVFPGLAPAATTVVVVRHAEKVEEPGNRDPELSGAGVERAVVLTRLLRDVPLSAVYSSDFIRTRKTAEPVAEQAGVAVLLRDPREAAALRDEILRDHPGGVSLVVGHSNTVPLVLGALGVTDPPEIAEDRYDDYFVVVIEDEAGAAPTLLHLHYGEVSGGAGAGSPDEKP
jgi:broad specificity phosphatase PhoE